MPPGAGHQAPALARTSVTSAPVAEPEGRVSGEHSPAPRAEQKSSESVRLPESIQYLGRLADKMFVMGRIDAAVNILGAPIAQLVAAANAGLTIDPYEIDAAGRYALRLAHETLEARWVDAAIELHLVTCRPLRVETAEQLAILRSKVPVGSASLLRRYQEKLRGHMSEMNAEDRGLSERVGKLT